MARPFLFKMIPTIYPRKSSSLPQRRKVRKEFRWLTNTMLSPFRLEPFSNHRADFLSVLGVFAVQLPFLGIYVRQY
jgi:hypothetical protein